MIDSINTNRAKNSLMPNYKVKNVYRFVFIMVFILGIGYLVFNDVFKIVSHTKTTMYSVKGNQSYEDLHWGSAEIFYKKGLKIQPENHALTYNLGNAYYQQGRYAEAVVVYENIVSDKNSLNEGFVWNNLGSAYYKLGLVQKSYTTFKRALILDDSDAVIRQNFLFLAHVMQKIEKSKIKNKNTKKKPSSDDEKNTDKKSDDSKGERNENNQQTEPYQLSDEEMNNLLKMATEKVRVPQNVKSKRTKKTHQNGPDY